MTTEKPFTSITFNDNSVCDIYEPKAGHLLRAGFQMMKFEHDLPESARMGIFPHIVKEIILLDGKELTLSQVLNLSMDSYIKINEVLGVLMKDINKLF